MTGFSLRREYDGWRSQWVFTLLNSHLLSLWVQCVQWCICLDHRKSFAVLSLWPLFCLLQFPTQKFAYGNGRADAEVSISIYYLIVNIIKFSNLQVLLDFLWTGLSSEIINGLIYKDITAIFNRNLQASFTLPWLFEETISQECCLLQHFFVEPLTGLRKFPFLVRFTKVIMQQLHKTFSKTTFIEILVRVTKVIMKPLHKTFSKTTLIEILLYSSLLWLS